MQTRYEGTPGRIEVGDGELILIASRHDPLHEILVEAVLSARYVEGFRIRMGPGVVVAELDPVTFQPYTFNKMDFGNVLE